MSASSAIDRASADQESIEQQATSPGLAVKRMLIIGGNGKMGRWMADCSSRDIASASTSRKRQVPMEKDLERKCDAEVVTWPP